MSSIDQKKMKKGEKMMQKMQKIEYRLYFLSDWHIGSGTGIPGIVDNGVLKDENNLPVITGKTIKGIARDALEDLLGILEKFAPRHREEEKAGNPVAEIFGGEGNKEGQAIFYNPVICQNKSDRESKEYKKFLEYFKEKALGEVRYHTSIDKDTGVAKDGHLFSEETSDHLLEFFGTISAPGEYTGLLAAALRFITKIGGKRRRGLGQCQFNILSPTDYDTRIQELFS
jgi:CRISPR/Cas system CSM-associated protein Csm3 (group 7 of RAMP superfamily)